MWVVEFNFVCKQMKKKELTKSKQQGIIIKNINSTYNIYNLFI